MVLVALPLELRLTGVELGLVDPVSGQCDWVWCHVKYPGHDTSERQDYKSVHVATRHRRDMTEKMLKEMLN